MDSLEFIDPHLGPELVLLRNKIGTRPRVDLAVTMGDVMFVRRLRLRFAAPSISGA